MQPDCNYENLDAYKGEDGGMKKRVKWESEVENEESVK